jgi:hypothetical protein
MTKLESQMGKDIKRVRTMERIGLLELPKPRRYQSFLREDHANIQEKLERLFQKSQTPVRCSFPHHDVNQTKRSPMLMPLV